MVLLCVNIDIMCKYEWVGLTIISLTKVCMNDIVMILGGWMAHMVYMNSNEVTASSSNCRKNHKSQILRTWYGMVVDS